MRSLPTEVRELRTTIDALDREIVALLDQRLVISREIQRIKADHGAEAEDLDREAVIRARAAEAGLEVETIYRVILRVAKHGR
jgi:chorismate mutase